MGASDDDDDDKSDDKPAKKKTRKAGKKKDDEDSEKSDEDGENDGDDKSASLATSAIAAGETTVKRIKDVIALCGTQGVSIADMQKFIESGASLSDVRKQIAAAKAEASSARPVDHCHPDANEKATISNDDLPNMPFAYDRDIVGRKRALFAAHGRRASTS